MHEWFAFFDVNLKACGNGVRPWLRLSISRFL